MRIDKNTTIRLGDKNIVRIKIGDSVIWEKKTEPEIDYFYIESLGDGNTISVINEGNGNTDKVTPTLEYSTDKNTWNTITFDWTSGTHTTKLPILNTGGKMYFRNDTRKFSGSFSNYITFSSSVSSNVGGDIRTLSNYLDVNSETKPQSYMFRGLFDNNNFIVDASNLKLPYTTLADGCYYGLFYYCTSLVNAPELPATKLADYCYYNLFYGCKSLVNAPTLPATTLAYGCYNSLFYGCTSLVNAPELPATTLANYCYSGLFSGCTSLVNAPELPATKLADNCYYNLFKGCTSLVNAPTLPATTLVYSCYNSLFYGCTSLVNAPELPATKLANYCYSGLFSGCTSLVNAPELPATKLADNCYYNLFKGCSSLNSITVYANDISAADCTKNWLLGVASTGTFNNMGSATYIKNSTNGIPTGWTVVNSNEPNYFYVENTYNGNNNIYVKTRAGYSNTEPTGEFATTLEYSKDKTNWTTINLNYDYHMNGSIVVSSLVTNLTLSLSAGEKVYFRNTSGYFGYVGDEGTHSHQFSSDENIKVGGNIKSLLDYRDMVGTTMKKGCFYEMFSESYNLRDASELILPDTVADSCYLGLFSSCVYLTSIPSLPALTMAPRCYCEMLKNTAITTPPELPSTNLAEYCYKNMLEGTPITTAPALPATTLSVGCYQGLFNSCNKLTTAPVLPATTLVDYCYRYLFMGCTKLNSITTYANNINAEECTRWWLESVASSGTLHNLGSATYVTDSGDGIPTGWTEVKS